MKILRASTRDLLHSPVEDLMALNLDQVRATLRSWLKRELQRAGFGRMVVGLSGGIDSALSAAVAVEALGPEFVHTVFLPHELSSEQSRVDSERLAKFLGTSFEIRDITQMVDGYVLSLPEAPPKLRLGNLMARARMTILYDLSGRDSSLVLGTSNKTEILLGYSTLWGDGAYALNPLGDLYKTQVRALSRLMRLPEFVIGKPPTADLWEGQTDENDLGFSYEDADRVLYLWIDHRYRPSDLLEAGFDQALLHRIMELVRKNQFKRRLPLWPKISPRTAPIDFRYLRDWGT